MALDSIGTYAREFASHKYKISPPGEHQFRFADLDSGETGPGGGDYKTRLQELAARLTDQLPRYHVKHEGPDHSRRFFATFRRT